METHSDPNREVFFSTSDGTGPRNKIQGVELHPVHLRRTTTCTDHTQTHTHTHASARADNPVQVSAQ